MEGKRIKENNNFGNFVYLIILGIITGLIVALLFNFNIIKKDIKDIRDLQYEILDKVHETYRVE